MAANIPSLASRISSIPFSKNGYTFLSVIGIGGSSVVFEVSSTNYNSQLFAAKVTPKQDITTKDLSALKMLNHPYIISVYDVFEDDSNIYLITEYCSNGSLATMIKNKQIKKTEDKIYYMHKIADAVSFCHSKGIAHRDIKPANILIDSYLRPKLIDFGICEIVDVSKTHSPEGITAFYGTGPYLAPEIVLKNSYDPFAADVWALGITFYEFITGSLPWSTSNQKVMNDAICQGISSFPEGMNPLFQQLITVMTNIDPSERPLMSSIIRCTLFENVNSNASKSICNQNRNKIQAKTNMSFVRAQKAAESSSNRQFADIHSFQVNNPNGIHEQRPINQLPAVSQTNIKQRRKTVSSALKKAPPIFD